MQFADEQISIIPNEDTDGQWKKEKCEQFKGHFQGQQQLDDGIQVIVDRGFVGKEANLLVYLQEPPRGDGASGNVQFFTV